MHAPIKMNNMNNTWYPDHNSLFGRTVEDVIQHNFFNSFDTNIRSEGDAYHLQLAVPGFGRKNIDIHLDGRTMIISAKKQQRNRDWNVQEFSTTWYNRSFMLPQDADENKIKAKCRDGILTIRIKKVNEKQNSRVIAIGNEDHGTPNRVKAWWTNLKEKSKRIFNGRR